MHCVYIHVRQPQIRLDNFFYHRFLCCYLFNGNRGKRTYLGGSSVGLSPFSNIKDVISLSGIN